MAPETLAATAWLGVKLSVLATVLALLLPLVGEVSQWPMVAAVAAVAFTASWVQIGRVERGEAPVLAFSRSSSAHHTLG